LVIGVYNRVAELSDRPEGFVPKNSIPYKSLIPLGEIIADALGVGSASKKVAEHYNELTQNLKNEFYVLLDADPKEIEKYSLPEIAQGIAMVRAKKVKIDPGYDGVYGKIKIFETKLRSEKQNRLL
jgi:PHP family Zn ribbon phosphoesterase